MEICHWSCGLMCWSRFCFIRKIRYHGNTNNYVQIHQLKTVKNMLVGFDVHGSNGSSGQLAD